MAPRPVCRQKWWACAGAGLVLMVLSLSSCGAHRDATAATGSSAVTERGEVAPPCDTGARIEGDGPDYDSVAALSQASDAVVVGTVSKQQCVAGSPQGGVEMTYLVSEIKVEQVLSGEQAATTGAMSVVQLPGKQGSSTPLVSGDHVVLFLSEEDPGESALTEALGTHWTPVAWDNGVADVDEDGSTLAFRGGPLRGGTLTMAELRALLTER